MTSRKVAIAAVLLGCATAACIAGQDDESAEDSGSPSRVSRPVSSGAPRWMPWNFAALSRRLPVDRYTGPRQTVEIHVVDGEGRPVGGTEVQVLASAMEYGAAGLDDVQYEEWLAAQDEGEEDEEHAIGGRAVVERGRTDRKGVWLAQLKPGVEVSFVARDDSGREGAFSDWLTTEIPYEYEDECSECSDEERAELEGVEPTGPTVITIEIAEVAVLRGQVSDEQGRPVAGATLELEPLSGEWVESHQLIANGGRDELFVTGDDGRFSIPLRMFGAFDLIVYAANMRPLTEPAVQILPGEETDVALTMITAAEIRGVVRDASGNPVGGALVSANAEFVSAEGSASGATTSENGEFTLAGLERGKHAVTVRPHGNLLPLDLPGIDTGLGPLDLRLASGGTIHVEVDVARDLVDVARSLPVSVTVSGADELPTLRTFLGIDDAGHGSVDVEALESGSYRVTITDGVYLAESGPVGVGPSSIASVRLRLDASMRIPPMNIVAFEKSDYEYDSVSPGFADSREYEGLYEEEEPAEESWEPDVTIDVTDSGLIVLRAPAGPADRRLFGGDRVVSIDGRSVAEMDGWEARELITGAKDTTCRIVVDRPATRRTITVDLVRTRLVEDGDY